MSCEVGYALATYEPSGALCRGRACRSELSAVQDVGGRAAVSAIVSTLTSLPFTQLRRHRYFYLRYDGFYATLCVALLAVMRVVQHAPLIATWDHRYWLLLPLVCHAQILCSVWI